MALSTIALAAWLRDVLLVREGAVLTRDVADERARNVVMQLGEILAQTRCRCGELGTVNGDLCSRCYMGEEWPPPREITDETAARIVEDPTGPEFSDSADRAAEETLPPPAEDGSGSVRG